jgi:hypothetical protein
VEKMNQNVRKSKGQKVRRSKNQKPKGGGNRMSKNTFIRFNSEEVGKVCEILGIDDRCLNSLTIYIRHDDLVRYDSEYLAFTERLTEAWTPREHENDKPS